MTSHETLADTVYQRLSEEMHQQLQESLNIRLSKEMERLEQQLSQTFINLGSQFLSQQLSHIAGGNGNVLSGALSATLEASGSSQGFNTGFANQLASLSLQFLGANTTSGNSPAASGGQAFTQLAKELQRAMTRNF